jgi:hypothetical protein
MQTSQKNNIIKVDFGFNFKHQNYTGHQIEIRWVNALQHWHLTIDGKRFKFWTIEEVIGKINKEVSHA